ncbi:CubicO group peptidase, beta-lactamase class C family [Spirosomataceae bacterium TFI 002]|nr:CubicO group peptidase, beta-lactamase class C family [Spirosomataceae bacterium TFI 002]
MKQALILALSFLSLLSCQQSSKQEVAITAELINETIRPFNGVCLIAKDGKVEYLKAMGYSDFENKTSLKTDDQFVIGSLSKQVTAVLVLKAVDNNALKLEDKVGQYINDFPFEVTIHQLLSHTHGIKKLGEPLVFESGTSFAYSNLGYELLGQVLEKVNQKTYASQANELFESLAMKNSYSPAEPNGRKAVQGFTRDSTKTIVKENFTFESYEVPAALLISTAEDLLKWNIALHEGTLLRKELYAKMINPTATQNHSLFGEVGYGYAIRITDKNGPKEIGHTGYVPGFISMNYYYPETKTSIIMLENLDWNDESIKNTFCHELRVKRILEGGF